MTSYQSKKKVNVFLFSSRHKQVQFLESSKKLPDTVDFYNKTKCGVDKADAMLKATSVKVACRRWTVHVFWNLIDIILLNAFIVYKEVNKSKISRIQFLRNVIAELLDEPHGGEANESLLAGERNLPSDFKLVSKKRCQKKIVCTNNHTTTTCVSCGEPVCGSCSFWLCMVCEPNFQN